MQTGKQLAAMGSKVCGPSAPAPLFTCVAFSPDGKLLATGSSGNKASNTVYFYNIPQPGK